MGSPGGTTRTCVFIVALCLAAAAFLIHVPAFWAVMATAGLAVAALKMVKDVQGGKM